MIVICPAYSFNSIPISGKHEKVMFFDSFGFRFILLSETMMYFEISPEDFIVVSVGYW